MAISIKTIPMLTGAAAERFVREAEDLASVGRPVLTDAQKERLHAFLDKSRDFQFEV